MLIAGVQPVSIRVPNGCSGAHPTIGPFTGRPLRDSTSRPTSANVLAGRWRPRVRWWFAYRDTVSRFWGSLPRLVWKYPRLPLQRGVEIQSVPLRCAQRDVYTAGGARNPAPCELGQCPLVILATERHATAMAAGRRYQLQDHRDGLGAPKLPGSPARVRRRVGAGCGDAITVILTMGSHHAEARGIVALRRVASRSVVDQMGWVPETLRT